MLDEDTLRAQLRDRGVRAEARRLREDEPTAAMATGQLGSDLSAGQHR